MVTNDIALKTIWEVINETSIDTTNLDVTVNELSVTLSGMLNSNEDKECVLKHMRAHTVNVIDRITVGQRTAVRNDPENPTLQLGDDTPDLGVPTQVTPGPSHA